ncbi:MAG: sulfurtransferase complex subunit TusB [Candidatus Rokubacteria bacterium]|nr:sulfurtransferase complex subunit TusB [Candidatus Rokubacteria bacterium]
MVLFTVNKSPYLHGNLEGCLRLAPAGTPLVLYEDGVYAAVAGTRVEELMRQALARHPVYALEADLRARGLERLIEGVRVIDYAGFVELVEQHPVVPWL